MKKVKFLQAKTQKSFLFGEIFFMFPNKSFPKHFVTTCCSMGKPPCANKKFPKSAIPDALRLENQNGPHQGWNSSAVSAAKEHDYSSRKQPPGQTDCASRTGRAPVIAVSDLTKRKHFASESRQSVRNCTLRGEPKTGTRHGVLGDAPWGFGQCTVDVLPKHYRALTKSP